MQLTPRITLNGGLRYEFSTLPEEKYNRDSALPDLSASAPVVGPLYENPTYTNISPRLGIAWDLFGDGRTALRARLRTLLQHQQSPEPDRHGHQPAVHAAAGDRQPDLPESAVRSRQRDLDAAGAVRPRQPARARLQRQRPARALGQHRLDGRLRRIPRTSPAAQRRREPRAADGDDRRRPPVHRRRHAPHQSVVLDHRAQEQRR